MEFSVFKTAVAKRFVELSQHELFYTNTDRDIIWQTYLNTFTEGTNPIFRERAEHDCSCCKQFIRNIGNVVAIIDGRLESIWDISVGDPAYQVVADKMAAYVKSRPIVNKYRHYEHKVGTDRNFEETVSGTLTWNHFFVNLPDRYRLPKSSIDSYLGTQKASHDVLLRSLETITQEAVSMVLELDILKHIISVKLAERDAAVNAANKREQKARLQALIAQKKDAALAELPVEELEKMAAGL